MMWSSSPVPSWQHRAVLLFGTDTISATGNRHQLLGVIQTIMSGEQVIPQKQRPLVIRPSGHVLNRNIWW